MSERTGPWTCFHCNDTFMTESAARGHFGPDEGSMPACQIKASEGGLLEALRGAEAAAGDAYAVMHAESGEIARAYHANLSRHAAAVQSAEETGYARGLRDARYAEMLGLLQRWHALQELRRDTPSYVTATRALIVETRELLIAVNGRAAA